MSTATFHAVVTRPPQQVLSIQVHIDVHGTASRTEVIREAMTAAGEDPERLFGWDTTPLAGEYTDQQVRVSLYRS